MAGPKSELGKLLERVQKDRKARIAGEKLEAQKKRKKMPLQTNLNEMGYIRENGLDREDRRKFMNDRTQFRNSVNQDIEEREMYGMKKGIVYKDYNLLKAQKNGKKK